MPAIAPWQRVRTPSNATVLELKREFRTAARSTHEPHFQRQAPRRRPPARGDGSQHPTLRPRRGAPLPARAGTRCPRRTRSRRHHPLRPGQHPLRGRCDQHADLEHPQRGPLRLGAGRRPGGAVRDGWQGPARCGHPHHRRNSSRHRLPLFRDRVQAPGEGQGVGGGHGFGDPRAQRREPAHRHRPHRTAGRHRDAAPRLRDLRRLRGDGERARDQVFGRDRAHASFHRGVRAGDRTDARGDADPASPRTRSGPSCTTATSPGAASGSRPGSSPRDRAPTPGSGSVRCASSSAATW